MISGTPTAAGTYYCSLLVQPIRMARGPRRHFHYQCASFSYGFRLPDFLLTASCAEHPKLMLQIGANGTRLKSLQCNAGS